LIKRASTTTSFDIDQLVPKKNTKRSPIATSTSFDLEQLKTEATEPRNPVKRARKPIKHESTTRLEKLNAEATAPRNPVKRARKLIKHESTTRLEQLVEEATAPRNSAKKTQKLPIKRESTTTSSDVDANTVQSRSTRSRRSPGYGQSVSVTDVLKPETQVLKIKIEATIPSSDFTGASFTKHDGPTAKEGPAFVKSEPFASSANANSSSGPGLIA
jgi:hypothetical protein